MYILHQFKKTDNNYAYAYILLLVMKTKKIEFSCFVHSKFHDV